MKIRFVMLAVLLLLLLVCAACQKKEATGTGEKKVQVITTLFPVYDLTREVAGDRAVVTMLLPPGVEPHSFEPKPEDIFRVSKADIFIYTDRYMEPWAADLVKGIGNPDILVVDAGKDARFLPASEGHGHDEEEGHGQHHDHGAGMDPHIWLDFTNAQKMVDNIAVGLATKDPANRKYYLGRAVACNERLAALDKRYRDELKGCASRMFLHGGHYAFGYLAARYGLNYKAAYAVSANAEPTPKRIAELINMMKANGLKYVFHEELIAPTMADAIARESGATLLKLHGAHNISREELAAGVTFFSLMDKNLENLKVGLKCR
jgi:zinc transport system substrate-binding protein